MKIFPVIVDRSIFWIRLSCAGVEVGWGFPANVESFHGTDGGGRAFSGK